MVDHLRAGPGAGWASDVRRAVDADSPLRRPFEELAGNLLGLPRPVGSLLVTSPEPRAGCTSVCLGLGAALARTGRRVTVVDCNLDSPFLHRLFGRPNFTGLTNALENGRPLESYAFEALPGLSVVPTGPVPPGSKAWARSERLVEAVDDMVGSGVDTVILDAPVAGRVLETPTLSGGFDGVLLVIHATRTSKSIAREVTDDLLDAGVELLGVVLNGRP